jgi:hypothetical protein
MTINTAIKNLTKHQQFRATANEDFRIAPSTLSTSIKTILKHFEKPSVVVSELTNKDFNRLRNSKSDAEVKRILLSKKI